MLHYYVRHPNKTVHREQFDNSPYVTPAVRAAYEAYYEPLVRFFHYACQEGVFKEMPLAMLSASVVNVAAPWPNLTLREV